MPQRSRRVTIVAHCHLNANTKVHDLADYGGARTDVVAALVGDGSGIVQLPCPETTYLGLRRWGMTREQYDVPAYRRHCEAILQPTIDTLVALADDGCVIEAVIGVDGSPSCGVDRTCVGYAGGEIERLFAEGTAPAAADSAAPGVFMDVLRSLLLEAGLDVPFESVDEASTSS